MPAPSADPDLVRFAVDLTRAAGERTLSRFRTPDLRIETKGDGTPVTEADQDAEAFIRAELAASPYADDAVLGEEEGDVAGTTTRRWIVDPIDGTKAYLRGVPLYANLLAVEDEHGWVAAVINLPAAGECVFAGRGTGAFQIDVHGERPAQVAPRHDPAFLTASGFTHWDDDALLRVKRAGWNLRTWGDGYGYAMVATGRIDAMVDPAAALWDLAPMPLILAEAGGRFSTLDGSDDPRGGSGVATNGEGHDDLLALLRGD